MFLRRQTAVPRGWLLLMPLGTSNLLITCEIECLGFSWGIGPEGFHNPETNGSTHTGSPVGSMGSIPRLGKFRCALGFLSTGELRERLGDQSPRLSPFCRSSYILRTVFNLCRRVAGTAGPHRMQSDGQMLALPARERAFTQEGAFCPSPGVNSISSTWPL